MEIRKIPIDQINPTEYNPRKDLQPDDPEYEKLKKSIREFGLVEPLVWNKRTGNLIGGHQRLKILIENGIKEVDVSVVDLPENKEKALNIALNKIQGDWDLLKLKDLLQEIDTGEFDIEITGFDDEEIEDLINKYSVQDINTLLNEVDLSQAVDNPIWVVIRTKKENIGIIEQAILNLKNNGIKVEKSYDLE
jgi:ParB-like chromosome segregation protein Spo0J